jgi:hypothetical protein
MKALFITALQLFVACLNAVEPVVLPNAASPDGKFIVRLTHDRTKETDPPVEDPPDVQIIAAEGNKVLVTFPYAADPESDLQPLRTHIRAHWNAEGSAVALSFSERFYTHLLVYRLQGTLAKPEAFIAVTLPDTVPVIKAMVPRFKEFRSRWHMNFQGWPGRGTIQFSAGTGALIKTLADEDPNFMAVYSFTVDISDPNTPVIKRVELVTEE